jgi:hypothetical protein
MKWITPNRKERRFVTLGTSAISRPGVTSINIDLFRSMARGVGAINEMTASRLGTILPNTALAD